MAVRKLRNDEERLSVHGSPLITLFLASCDGYDPINRH